MEGRRLHLFTVVQMFVICPLLWFVFTIPGPWDLQRTMGKGVAVALSGIAVSRYHLGGSFSIRAEAHRLVTHGIYSKIRNSIYCFRNFAVCRIRAGDPPAYSLARGARHCGHANASPPPRSPSSRSGIR
jgi:hypothetical protein